MSFSVVMMSPTAQADHVAGRDPRLGQVDDHLDQRACAGRRLTCRIDSAERCRRPYANPAIGRELVADPLNAC